MQVLEELKAQGFLAAGSIFQAIRSATHATELEPGWADGWVTLGRAQARARIVATIAACKPPVGYYIHTYIHIYIHTYIYIRSPMASPGTLCACAAFQLSYGEPELALKSLEQARPLLSKAFAFAPHCSVASAPSCRGRGRGRPQPVRNRYSDLPAGAPPRPEPLGGLRREARVHRGVLSTVGGACPCVRWHSPPPASSHAYQLPAVLWIRRLCPRRADWWRHR